MKKLFIFLVFLIVFFVPMIQSVVDDEIQINSDTTVSTGSGGGQGGYLMTEVPEIDIGDTCTKYFECENRYYLKRCRMTMVYSGPICEEVDDETTNEDGSGSGHGVLCSPGTNELECICRDDEQMKELCDELDEHLKKKGIVFPETEEIELVTDQTLKAKLQYQQKVISGNYIGESGQQIKIQKKLNNVGILEVGGVSVDYSLNMTQEQIKNKTKFKAILSNGKNVEIKIMPNVASETALEKLKLKNCVEEDGCLIELKEVGNGEKTKLAYELKTPRQAKVFGLFKTEMNVQAQVDSETGEVIQIRKPWWAFLASEPEEE